MNIMISKIFGSKVSLGVVGKPYLFRIPKYQGADKKISDTNIALVSDIIGKKVIIPNQYHSSEVVLLDEKNKNKIVEGDAIITQLRDVAIFILASDCVPIILYHEESGTIGVIHAGRKGLETGIIKSTLDTFADNSFCEPNKIKVYVGACISMMKYELGLSEIECFLKDYTDSITASKEETGKYYLDIRSIAEKQLLTFGILQKNIQVSVQCTYLHSEEYHSYRRHTHNKEEGYGNNAFGIWFESLT